MELDATEVDALTDDLVVGLAESAADYADGTTVTAEFDDVALTDLG